MPFLAYVHAQEPDPPEPSLRRWRWVAAAIGFAVAAALTSGVLEAALVLVVFGLCCRAALELLPDGGGGLREWKQ